MWLPAAPLSEGLVTAQWHETAGSKTGACHVHSVQCVALPITSQLHSWTRGTTRCFYPTARLYPNGETETPAGLHRLPEPACWRVWEFFYYFERSLFIDSWIVRRWKGPRKIKSGSSHWRIWISCDWIWFCSSCAVFTAGFLIAALFLLPPPSCSDILWNLGCFEWPVITFNPDS